MARTRNRWKAQREGTRHGSLNRAVGSPRGRKVPARLVKAARKGKYGRSNQRRAYRGSGR